MAERRRRADESSAESIRLQVEAEAWLEGRSRAGREAQAEVVRGRAASPELHSRGRAAYARAAVEFQNRNPRPDGVAEGQLIKFEDVEMSV